ncbi:hypothetical protein GCM10022252_20200 [Streptosporangium oxazolinicum]|uniref:Uncharacterized protein n=1 Tax=Streptosporangium oxazolinicum TaxID=909287 RepID=A0ABP8APL5_9ACTN
MLGPDNLNDLQAPETVWRRTGLVVGLARGDQGVYYEIVVDIDVPHTIADIIAGLRLLPQDALIRDAFNYPDGICVNFWKDAA